MFNHLRDDIASIIKRDPAARNAWEVLTCYPGLHAIIMHRWSHWCWLHGMKWLGRFIAYVARILTGIELHPGATIGHRVFIDHGFGVVVGETAVIGDDCTIYQGVTLGGTSLSRGSKRHPTLEAGVIVGAGAQVLGGFTVGTEAKIGSNSVVLKPVPAGATAVGNPAHIVHKNAEPDQTKAHIFSAYGISANGDDPVSKTLQQLIEHVLAQQKQIENLNAALDKAGMCAEAVTGFQKLEPKDINRLLD
jgi:serine O-acetyltransferase